MNTDTKFLTIMSPEADQALDALDAEQVDATLNFVAITLPNITRRDAVVKATTPFGTIFTFQVPETSVLVNCLNGHNQDGQRIMIVAGIGVAR